VHVHKTVKMNRIEYASCVCAQDSYEVKAETDGIPWNKQKAYKSKS
jgi:hypothetical protein